MSGQQAWLLVGSANTRKSTLARCLTGCFNRNVRDIDLSSGGALKLYARVSALQESRTSAQDFLTEVARSRCEHVLFSLWPQHNPTDPQRWPDAQQYVDQLRQAGWQFPKVVVLGADPIRLQGTGEVLRIPVVKQQGVNTTAQQVRQHFGWR